MKKFLFYTKVSTYQYQVYYNHVGDNIIFCQMRDKKKIKKIRDRRGLKFE
jgi:hypothetical protein